MELQHLYATKEFEKQVIARLPNIEGVERLPEYTITEIEFKECSSSEIRFEGKFTHPPNRHYDSMKKGGSKAEAANGGGTHTFECDLYLKTPMNTLLGTIFHDIADDVIALNPQNFPIPFKETNVSTVLCEIAETPQSLRRKLWQLERALRFGPQEIRQPDALVVALNGAQEDFIAFAEAARQSLELWRTLEDAPEIVKRPLFCIWTQYRNVYAEIKSVKHEINSVKHEIKTLNDKIDRLIELLMTQLTQQKRS
jgi:hypothetical protein